MNKLNLYIWLGVGLGLVACTKHGGARDDARAGMSKVVIDAGAIAADKNAAKAERAERLALAAEQLMSGASFMYATEVADSALAIDPANKRAQLMKHLAAPAMLSRGLIKRMRPFVALNKDVRADYDRLVKDVTDEPRRELKTFLLDGGQEEDIRTERQAQAHLDLVRESLTALRLWIKTNKTTNMTLHVPAEYVDRALRQHKRECDVTPLWDHAWELECDFTHALELKMTAADLEGVQAVVAGLELEVISLTAYDLSDGLTVADRQGLDSFTNKKVFVNHLLQNPSFGGLRHEGRALKQIVGMGLDGLTGYRWLQRRQDHLCKPGPRKRPGYVFKDGVCVDQDERPRGGLGSNDPRYGTHGQLLSAIKTALEGGVTGVIFTDTHGKMDVDLKLSAALVNPPLDLRSVAPTVYDECNQIRGIRDQTGGGVFVNGDLNRVLALGFNGCLKK